MPTLTYKYDDRCQHYGEFFAGFPWTLFGCCTFRNKVSRAAAPKIIESYFRRLTQNIRSRIAYIAVPEYRTSGCGLYPIPLHYHLLMACPARLTANLLKEARSTWRNSWGDTKIDPYDPSRSGARYLAKLASGQDFDFLFDQLDRLGYVGPADLFATALEAAYVPPHVKGTVGLQTLVIRDPITRLPISRSLHPAGSELKDQSLERKRLNNNIGVMQAKSKQ